MKMDARRVPADDAEFARLRPLASLPRLACVTLLALAACSPPAPREYAGHGEAIEVDAAARTVTLDHGDIPDLMKGMTMTFDVAPSVDLASLAPGTEVDFRLSDAEGGLTVVEIRPVGDAAESGPASQSGE